MQLTFLSQDFACWLFLLVMGSFLLSWISEKAVFPELARAAGRAHTFLRPGHRKQRRQYKVLLEEMQVK